MSSGLKDMSQDTRTSGLSALQAAAQGTKPWPEFVADLQKLDGVELRELVTQADQAAAADPSNGALRMALAYAYAVYRDFRFSMAQGRFAYALGINQALRGVYEGGRINIDATVTS